MTPSDALACRKAAAKRSQGHEQAGPLSSEIKGLGCRRRRIGRKAIPPRRYSRVAGGPRGVEEPGHVRNLHAREPGEPIIARLPDLQTGRAGKAEAASPR